MKRIVFATVTAVLVFLGGCASIPIPGKGRMVYVPDEPRTVNYPAPAVAAPPASPSGSAYAPPAYAPPPYGGQILSNPPVNPGAVPTAPQVLSVQRQWDNWRGTRIVSLQNAEAAWKGMMGTTAVSDAQVAEYLQKWWTARGNVNCAKVRAKGGMNDTTYQRQCHAVIVTALQELNFHGNYAYRNPGDPELRRTLTRIGKGFEYPLFR